MTEPEPRTLGHAALDRPDPLAPLRRRVERLALAGRAALPVPALEALDADAARLAAAGAPTAAALLHALGSATRPGQAPEALAERWLGAVAYLRAVDRAALAAEWRRVPW